MRFITPQTAAVPQSSTAFSYSQFVTGILAEGVPWVNNTKAGVVGMATVSLVGFAGARVVNMKILDVLGTTLFDNTVAESGNSTHDISIPVPFFVNAGESVEIYEVTATASVSVVASFARVV